MDKEQELHTRPSPEQLELWFKQYGALFTLDILDQLFLFRYLTRREFRLLLTVEDEDIRAEQLCETVVLWPEDYTVSDNDPAGIATALSAEVLRQSGFGTDMKQRFEDHYKIVSENIEPQMEALVEYVFGNNGGKFNSYQDWSHEELFDAYQRALWIMQVVEAKEHLTPQKTEKTLTPQDVLNSLRKDAKDEGKDPHSVNMSDAMIKFRNLQRQEAVRAKTQGQQPPANRPPMAGIPGVQ